MKIKKELSIEEIQDKVYELFLYLKKICEQENIRYFMGYGTLLGAVRHQGFIPWDDDIDIMMLPDDYIRFSNAVTKYPDDRYFFQCKNTDQKFPVPEMSRICLNNSFGWPEDYEKAPFHTGIYIDIFPLSYGNVEYSEMLKKMQVCRKIHTVFMQKYMAINLKKSVRHNVAIMISKMFPHFLLEKMLFKNLNTNKSGIDYEVVCSYASAFAGDSKFIYPINYFSGDAKLMFESSEVNCPQSYEELLIKSYGKDYMIPINTKTSSHKAYEFVEKGILPDSE